MAAPATKKQQSNPLYSSKSAHWYTPRWLVLRIVAFLRWIDLDPCSNPTPPYTIPAKHNETKHGLQIQWKGKIFLNPPYGRGEKGIERWIAKLIDAYNRGDITEAIALIPARIDTDWYKPFKRQCVTCEIDGRISFIDGRPDEEREPDSPEASTAGFPSVLVYLGPRIAEFGHAFADIGDVRYPLFPPRPGQPIPTIDELRQERIARREERKRLEAAELDVRRVATQLPAHEIQTPLWEEEQAV